MVGDFHRAEGVELMPESKITAFEGDERVRAAVTADGDRIECDFAVVGVGIEPVLPSFTSSGRSGERPARRRGPPHQRP